MDYLVGVSGICFIFGLAAYPSTYDRLMGATRLPSCALFALSALSLIGAACT